MRTRSQGLTAPVAQDLDRDLLLAAVSKADPVVKRLMAKYRCCISFRPGAKLDAVRNQLLAVMLPSAVVDAVSSPPHPSPVPDLSDRTSSLPNECCSGEGGGPLGPLTLFDTQCAGCPSRQTEEARPQQPSATIDAVSSPTPPSPLPDLPVSARPLFVPDECHSRQGEGPLGSLTLPDVQCVGCHSLRHENERLQQGEQQASQRIAMLEAENQHLRSMSQHREGPGQPSCRERAAEADSATATELGAEAPVAEPPVSPESRAPPPPERVAQSLQVVVRGLRGSGNATTAVLQSTFARFCCDQLHLRGALTMRAVKVFKTPPGTMAGVLALQSWQELEALFQAKRQHLDEDCAVSIQAHKTRAERRACATARRARRATLPLQRSAAAGDRTETAGQPHSTNLAINPSSNLNSYPRRSTLRADAPEFVPASAAMSPVATSVPSSIVPQAHALHQE